jgi:glyoxylase-like metal-dependent hydrolase (beta-lactamase superfamily II)
MKANCYLLYDEKGRGVIIDPGGEEQRINREVVKRGLTIEHVLLTHAHFDHIMGVRGVMNATGADLIVPFDDAAMLRDRELSLTYMVDSSAPPLEADRLVSDGDTIVVGELTINVLHTPGHTPGGTCYICNDLLFSGDTLFKGTVGRVDFPGGDRLAMKQSMKKLSELEGEYTVLPGHDAATTLSVEKRMNPYMNGADNDLGD